MPGSLAMRQEEMRFEFDLTIATDCDAAPSIIVG